MTLADQHVPVIAWDEPDGLIPRGTVVVIPGRGETPAVYERFGRRLAGDAYRVRAVTDPAVDAELARAQVSGLLAGSALPAPRVLAGSDTGALFAIMLARSDLGVTGMPQRRGLNWSASQGAGTTCSTTGPTGRSPPPSCCSWNGSGRTLARAPLRSGSSSADDERPGGCMPEHERSVLVMC